MGCALQLTSLYLFCSAWALAFAPFPPHPHGPWDPSLGACLHGLMKYYSPAIPNLNTGSPSRTQLICLHPEGESTKRRKRAHSWQTLLSYFVLLEASRTPVRSRGSPKPKSPHFLVPSVYVPDQHILKSCNQVKNIFIVMRLHN